MPRSIITRTCASASLLGLAFCSAVPAPSARDSVRSGPLPATPATTVPSTPEPSRADAGKEQTSPVQADFTRILAQNTSGYAERVELVVRDRKAFESAWRTVFAGNQGAPLPEVDFARSIVVLIALGEQRTGGYSVEVDRVARTGDAAVVHYTVTGPGPGCMSTMMITSPVEIVSMPRVAGTVSFSRTTKVEPC
jgi:hypothetical protein